MRDIEASIKLIQELVEHDQLETHNQQDFPGLILYYYTLYKLVGTQQYANKVTYLLEQTLANKKELLGTENLRSLFLVKNFQRENLLTSNFLKELEELDTLFFEQALVLLEKIDFSNLYKVFEIIYYLNERLPSSKVIDYLKKILQIVQNSYNIHTNFWKGSDFFQNSDPHTHPLGLAHGISGMLIMLIHCYACAFQTTETKKIIKDGILYMLSFKQEVDFSSRKYAIFPAPAEVPDQTYLATEGLSWCSSDLNQALLFYRANELFQDEQLKNIADVVGLNTLLRKDLASTAVESSCLYQGAAGIAHTYRTLYIISQHSAYKQGYDYWIEQTLAFLETELASGYYQSKKYDLLHGLIGVALTLLSYNHEDELEWSKCLLLETISEKQDNVSYSTS